MYETLSPNIPFISVRKNITRSLRITEGKHKIHMNRWTRKGANNCNRLEPPYSRQGRRTTRRRNLRMKSMALMIFWMIWRGISKMSTLTENLISMAMTIFSPTGVKLSKLKKL